MLKLRTYTIARDGKVNWHVEGDSHCGPKAFLIRTPNGNAIPVEYRVRVTCAPNLDNRGFLFDQASLGLFMERLATRPTTLSCEALAGYVAEQIQRKIEKDVPTCRVVKLSLTLSPAPHVASITVDFE